MNRSFACLGSGRRPAAFVVLLSLLPVSVLAAVVRVPDDFATLGAALDVIASGDTVLVAPGEYSGMGNRDLLVRAKEFVLLGEAGAAETIVDCGFESGALWLELQTRATTIDGFTFQRADESALTFRSSGPVVRNCVFRDNHIGIGDGAALTTLGTSPVLLENCRFEGNTVFRGSGGAAFCDDLSRAEFVECVFLQNEAEWGGAISGKGNLTLVIRGCLFAGNTGIRGGAGHFYPRGSELSSVTIERSTFAENTAEGAGGAIYVPGGSRVDLSVDRSLFFANTAAAGAALHLERLSGVPEISCSALSPTEIVGEVSFQGENVVVDPALCLGVEPPEYRYALQLGSPCTTELSPCGERIGALPVGCPAGGGGACCHDDGTCLLTTRETCDGVYQGDFPCDLQPCASGGACCLDGNCSITTEEHCARNGGIFLAEDRECPLEGCPLVACCLDDGTCRVTEVDDCLPSGGDCYRDVESCDPDPCGPRALRVPGDYGTMAAALSVACPGDTVLLAPGTYTGPGNRDLHIEGEGLVIASEGGPEVTVIDCERSGRAFEIWAARTSVRIEGLTIRGGRPYFPDYSDVLMGGGVLLRYGELVLVDCIVEGNRTSGNGGGIAAFYGRLRIEDCRIVGNLASYDRDRDGGGVFARDSEVVLLRSKVAGNRSNRGGGGIYLQNGSLVVDTSVLSGNHSGFGAGIWLGTQSGDVDAEVRGTTIAGNSALVDGGGIFFSGSADLSVTSSVLWGNHASRQGGEVWFGTAPDSAVFSCSVVYTPGVQGGGVDPEDGTILQDPLFCAPVSATEAPTSDGDYTVAANSICLDGAPPCAGQIGAHSSGCDPVEVGACCSGTDLACLLASEVECLRLGWVFAGSGVLCDPSPCEVPGACCFVDGTCGIFVEAFCLERNGRTQGPGSACDPNPCPQPQGCCREGIGCRLLPPVVCEEAGGFVLAPEEPCHPYTCEPNANGRFLMHVNDPGQELPVLETCADAQNVAPDSANFRVSVIAAFPPENVPRLRQASFALTYPEDAVEVVSWGVYTGTALPDETWPAPGSNIVIRWDEALRGSLEPLCWFDLGVSGEAAEFSAIARADGLSGFLDDFVPPNQEEAVCYGSVGIGGASGGSCCWSLEACCNDLGECEETTREHCYNTGRYTQLGSCPCSEPAVLVGEVTVEERDFQVELSWRASSDVGFREFRVLRGDTADDPAVSLGGGVDDGEGEWSFLDATVAPGRSYTYWLEATETNGGQERFGPWEVRVRAASEPRILAVRPNPTRGATDLDLFLPQALEGFLTVYDAGGRVVAEVDFGSLPAGRSVRTWDGRDGAGRMAASGVYFLQLRVGAWRLANRIIRVD